MQGEALWNDGLDHALRTSLQLRWPAQDTHKVKPARPVNNQTARANRTQQIEERKRGTVKVKGGCVGEYLEGVGEPIYI